MYVEKKPPGSSQPTFVLEAKRGGPYKAHKLMLDWSKRDPMGRLLQGYMADQSC